MKSWLESEHKNMSECSHNCESCQADCKDRTAPNSFLASLHESSSVKKVIGIVSGKGGVGKSLVTSLLAIGMQKRGFQCGILDADITGPSIPKELGITKRGESNGEALLPCKSTAGIDVMSINLLLENPTDPVVWRGPIIGNVVKQFWSEVIWENEDFMFVDMPPGTGDVPLTVFQSLPVDGIVIVTSPQELVSMIVTKAIKMAASMNIPVLGIVENMSYLTCPDCGKEIPVFGDSHVDEIAAANHLEVLGKIPMNREIAEACDSGTLELLKQDYLEKALDQLSTMLS